MDSERQSRKLKKAIVLKVLFLRDMVVSYPALYLRRSAILVRSVLQNGGTAEMGLGRDIGQYVAYTLSQNN